MNRYLGRLFLSELGSAGFFVLLDRISPLFHETLQCLR